MAAYKKRRGIYISSFQIIIFKSNKSCNLQVEWLCSFRKKKKLSGYEEIVGNIRDGTYILNL